MRIRTAALAILSLTVIATFGNSGRAWAGPFDGRWTVLVVTEKGTCDIYRWRLSVNNGRITEIGDNIARASGRISGKGIVSVTLTRGEQVLSATGRLRGTRGAGRWVSPSRACSGRWEAERLG